MGWFNNCRSCENRTVGCHSTCEKYIEDRARYDEIKERERKDNDIKGCLNRMNIDKFNAIHKGKKEI